MDFNLFGDAAQAAKLCCSEMATGQAGGAREAAGASRDGPPRGARA
jgi:hypothetical protein